jgi:acyl-CoA thioester hydrolase
VKIRVYYEDTDAGGIVYYANYLNFCERARSDAFFSVGKLPVLESGHFVVKKVIADYLLSAKLGDLLDVKTELLNMGVASFSLNQAVYKDEKKLFEMQVTLAYISFEGRVQKIDATLKEFIVSLFDGD